MLATASSSKIVARRPAWVVVVASSMSIYGEGAYAARARRGCAAAAPGGAALEREWECACPICGAELAPVATHETKPLIPTTIYAMTKRDHEELCLVVGAAYGIPSVALRYFNVYGPRQALSNPYTAWPRSSSRLLNGRPPLIFEDGMQSRDFTHVTDIVRGHPAGAGGRRFVRAPSNLGTGS